MIVSWVSLSNVSVSGLQDGEWMHGLVQYSGTYDFPIVIKVFIFPFIEIDSCKNFIGCS